MKFLPLVLCALIAACAPTTNGDHYGSGRYHDGPGHIEKGDRVGEFPQYREMCADPERYTPDLCPDDQQ